MLSTDAGFVRGVPGVSTVDVDGTEALIEVDDDQAAARLLTEALARGAVREFSAVRPSLAEIYREVIA